MAIVLAGCCCKKPAAPDIVIWHWMNDREPAFNELTKKYFQATGVTVEFKLLAFPDIYAQKVRAAARAGNLPDIFGILGEKSELVSFIKGGYLVDLTKEMEKDGAAWKNSFYKQTLDVVSFPATNRYGIAAGIYGVPIDTTAMQFIYNKKLLKNIGVNNPPATLDEMISYAKKIHEKNPDVYGFSCGWGETWLINCLATEWAINVMGEEKFLKTIEGKVPYTDKEWIEVFALFAKLRDSGILAPNITTMINKESEDLFSKNKAVFSFNGTWSINVYSGLNKDLDYAYFALPRVSEKNKIKIWGGAGSSFMVNPKSANKDKAIAFLKWVTAPEQQKFLVEKTNNLPAIKLDDDLPLILKPVINGLNDLTHPNVWPANEDSRVVEILNKDLQQIIMGLKTPQEAGKDIQEAKERFAK
jgi:ABC-type glycerol-3-phosphate transport system substrate-binding protein